MADSFVYRVPVGRAEYELREKGSRFLAIVEPAADADSVRERIRRYERRFADASHVCWAWRMGNPAAEGRSDAGEPAGTAGEPMLRVLQGAGISDVLAVVVRWFGGVKLGKGGLARAYAGSLKGALEGLSVAEQRPVVRLQLSVPFARVGDVKRLVHPPQVNLVEESYDGLARMTLEVDCREEAEILEALESFALAIDRTGSESADRTKLERK